MPSSREPFESAGNRSKTCYRLKYQGRSKRPQPWIAASTALFAAVVFLLLLVGGSRFVNGQTAASGSDADSVFTTAHDSLGDAVRHFLGWRPEPEQPIPFPHQTHIDEAFLECDYCHSGVARGPVARLPSVVLCMDCHFDIATDREPIQLLTSYYNQGQEPPWERVYGWHPESHVRFNHAPHIRAEVECATCHGNVAGMTVAERAVEHTMSFCVSCHEQNQAPIECTTCHY